MKNSYNILTKIFLVLALVVQTSCSWIGVRTPAAKKLSPTVSYEDVFSFEKSSIVAEKEFKKEFIQSLGYNYPNNLAFEVELSKDLPENVAFRLEMEVINDKYTYKILHSSKAFKDVTASYELGLFISKLIHGTPLQNHLSNFEMFYNAKEGDPIALDNFLKIRGYNSTGFSAPYLNTIPDDIEERFKAADELRSQLAPQIKEFKEQRKILEAKRKALLDKLDKAPDAKQFRTLVAKGDRKGVADLLEKYLPFEEMTPFEKRFWETHLDVIRNPVPLDQRVLIYRGLQDDFIHSAYDAGKELDKEDAIKEGKAFVMSTVLVKNQGSWNRRLRSLEAMNGKFIATIANNNEFSQSARISTMFLKHSANPQGSPFLSFTPNFGVAQNFGSTKMMSALIDPRLMHFNYASSFANEIEFLLPLVTFPDELVGLWHQDYNSGVDKKAFLEERLKMRITDEFGKSKADEIIKRIKKNSADFFEPVYKNGEAKITKVSGGTMAAFYKKFAKAGDIKPAMTLKGDLTCKDLLKIFWTVP